VSNLGTILGGANVSLLLISTHVHFRGEWVIALTYASVLYIYIVRSPLRSWLASLAFIYVKIISQYRINTVLLTNITQLCEPHNTCLDKGTTV
jgi:hypothetical protein